MIVQDSISWPLVFRADIPTAGGALVGTASTRSPDLEASIWAAESGTPALRGSGLEWTNSFVSLGTSYATLYWQKFWVDVDYTLPAGVPNPLFFNELF